jgi:hypothetical protein
LLLRQARSWALGWERRPPDGRLAAASMATVAVTTSNSVRVKAF